MKMVRSISMIFVLLCFNLSLIAKDPVVCITIPKCGTNMLMKTLSLLGDSSMKYNYSKWAPQQQTLDFIRVRNMLPPPHHFRGRFGGSAEQHLLR